MSRAAALAAACRRTAAIAATLLTIAGANAATAAPAAAQDAANKMLEAAAMSRALGSDSAAVTVFEIADFQCPFCAQFATRVFPQIESTYIRTGRVQWVFVNLPLPMHPNAWAAAEAALCAGAAANGFWSMHEQLYAHQKDWSDSDDARSTFAAMAKKAGADAGAYQRCVVSDQVAPLIVQDVIGAAGSGISGTPTFIVNREEKVVGVKSFDEWKEILERAEARADSAAAASH